MTSTLHTKEEFTVGWICALDVESAAAQEMLDEEYENVETDSSDQNIYSFGKIGEYHVAIVCLAAGRYGLVSATSVATQMRASLPSLKIVLMVGIGGGVPRNDMDIRLGDVVVSQPSGAYGGVVQYDMSRTFDDKVERMGSHNSPPEALLNALQAVKIAQRRRKFAIAAHLEKLSKEIPEYARPIGVSDRLFKAEYVHQGGTTCENCAADMEVSRTERTHSGPVVHYGTIASGNQVMQSAATRDRLSKDLGGILCFEMEAAGIMNYLPCLVIRGISDYADSHKNYAWHEYASATAAAFAKEFLKYVKADQVARTKTITELLIAIEDKLDKSAARTVRVEEHADTAKTERILEWLSPSSIDYSRAQNRARNSHVSGTGEWLLRDRRYVEWRGGNSRLVWLYGVVGCGKTVLCSTIIHDIETFCESDSSSHVAYWYFQFDDGSSLDVGNMLRTVIRQLCHSPLPNCVRKLWDKYNLKAGQPSDVELLDTLDEIIREATGAVFLIFDALDEYPLASEGRERSVLLEYIIRLRDGSSHLRLLSTSRPEPDIRHMLERHADHSINIGELMNDDVARYVDLALQKPEFLQLGGDMASQMKERLLSFEERRFRWADLQIRRFKECPSTIDLENALKTIPKDLETTYALAFESIATERQADVRKILMWLACSFRQLTLEAITHIAGYFSGDHVLRVCTSLLVTVIDYQTSQTAIKLAHFSVKEFIICKQIEENALPWYKFSAELAHADIATQGLHILIDTSNNTDTEHANTLSENYLVEHIASDWPAHAKASGNIPPESKLQSKIEMLFDSEHAQLFKIWARLYDPWSRSNDVLSQRLYYAAALGLQVIVQKLWINESQLLFSPGQYGNALHAAACLGQAEIVSWIGSRCTKPDEYLRLGLFLENVRENVKDTLNIVLDLLGNQVITSYSMLVAAERDDHGLEMMQVLLDRRLDDVHITGSVVEAAVGNRHSGLKLLQLLLDTCPGEVHITEPVVKAASHYSDTMQLLLERRPNEIRITEAVLQAATSSANTMKLLLDRRPDDVRITGPVVEAASYHLDTMKLLLDRRPNEVRITEAVVEKAASALYSDTMELLLDRRPNEVRITEAVVEKAASAAYPHTMGLLLDRRPNEVRITEAVVEKAASADNSDMMELLLDRRPNEVRITEAVVEKAASALYSDTMELLLDRWPNEVRITEAVVEKAASALSSDTMKLLLDRWPNEVRITEAVVEKAASAAHPYTMKLLLDRRPNEVRITEAVVEKAASAAHPHTMKLLLDRRPNEVRITEAVVEKAASAAHPHTMKLLLDRRPNEVRITEAVVEKAASADYPDTMELLLDQRPDEIVVTKSVACSALRREEKGIERLQVLLNHPRVRLHDEVADYAVSCKDGNLLQLLLELRLDTIQVNTTLVEATARNEYQGEANMRLLLDRRSNEVQISNVIIEAAASNKGQGSSLLRLLLAKRADEITITDAVVEAAANNMYQAGLIMKLLLDQRPNEVRITNAVVVAAAGNKYCGEALMQLLLNERPHEVQITNAVIEAAVENKSSGLEVIQLLVDRVPDKIRISAVTIAKATQNKFCGVKILDLLLKRVDKQQWTAEDHSGRTPFQVLLFWADRFASDTASSFPVAQNDTAVVKLHADADDSTVKRNSESTPLEIGLLRCRHVIDSLLVEKDSSLSRVTYGLKRPFSEVE